MWARLTAALVAIALSPQPQGDRTDDFIRAQMQQQRIPGLSVAIVKDGQVVKATVGA